MREQFAYMQLSSRLSSHKQRQQGAVFARRQGQQLTVQA